MLTKERNSRNDSTRPRKTCVDMWVYVR